ncbi:MAG: ribonuclease R [Chloroherpetonaceae bacterium]|nr:ribonuclease R [Chloroherpetonaceae bacterium]
MPNNKKHRRDKRFERGNKRGAERPRPDDFDAIRDFLMKQGEKSIAAEIVNFLSSRDTESFRSRTIATELGYGSDTDLPGFWYVLHKLHEEGRLEKDSEKLYSLSKSSKAGADEVIETETAAAIEIKKPKFERGKKYIGKISTHSNGYGLVTIPEYDEEIYVPAHEVKKILHGDTVEVEVTLVPFTSPYQREAWSKRSEGKIVRLVERGLKEVVGKVERHNKFFRLVPDNSKLFVSIIIPLKDAKEATDGDKVVVDKLDFKDNETLTGKVKEVLGRAGDSKVEVLAIARSKGIDETFPKAVVKEADAISETIDEDEIATRVDMRQKLVFTIDPYDAKDFDDALSIEYGKDGNYIIGIHIADVSHYVTEGSKLDKEAQERSTSVYLVDRVIPMLPSNLSENICSLVPNEDRLTYSTFVTMNKNAEVLDYWIEKTVIHSKRRFTYEEVQDILNAGKGDHYKELSDMHKLSKIMTKRRMDEGAIDFDTEEIKFKLDDTGKPISVFRKQRLDSHRLIEEFMLLANRTVAAHVAKHFQPHDEYEKNYPSVYRIHDSPHPDRIRTLAAFVKKLGYTLEISKSRNLSDTASSKALRKLLEEVKGSPVEFMVSEITLRTMAKAIYSEKNIGHYGLGFEYYSHFTSPIRRYPDLIFHRLLFEYETLRKARKKLAKVRHARLLREIPEICKHSSDQERNATEAERDSIKLKQVEFISEHIGNTYPGVVSGVTEFGIYVKLDDMGVEGLIHIKNLLDDYYEFDERTYSLVGKRRQKRLQLGKRVQVKVHEVDPRRRTIDFLLVKSEDEKS